MGEVAVHALRDIDLDIYEREFVVLLGPSGSGKSTLLNILGGLDAPTSGEATWRDHDLVNAGDDGLTRYRREHVGFVFQFYNLIPSLTVLENVALVNEIADKPLDPREALALVGLTRAARPFPVATLRRRAAARRGRPRDRKITRRPLVRRANRRARLRHWQAGAGGHRSRQ